MKDSQEKNKFRFPWLNKNVKINVSGKVRYTLGVDVL